MILSPRLMVRKFIDQIMLMIWKSPRWLKDNSFNNAIPKFSRYRIKDWTNLLHAVESASAMCA